MKRILFTVSCVALSVAPAFADPVQITAGQYVIAGSLFARTGLGRLVGNGLLLTFGVEFAPSGLQQCSPCIEGNPVPLSFSAIAESDSGHATIDRVFGAAFATLEFRGPTVSSAILGPDHLTLSEPFTMSGFVFSQEHTLPAPRPFDIFGSGVATAQFSLNRVCCFPQTAFEFRSVTFAFEPAPTPEPASLLLLAIGGVVLFIFAKGSVPVCGRER